MKVVKFTIGLFAFLAILMVAEACKKPPVEISTPTFDRSEMLKSIANKVIIPYQSQFNVSSNELKELANQSENAGELSASELEKIQEQWKTLTETWKACELFNLGPIRDSYLHNKIESNPPNEEFIQEYISGSSVLNEAFVESKGSNSKGIRAIEYLCFAKNENNDSIRVSFSDQDSLGTRRIQFLNALCDNLQSKSDELQNYWNPNDANSYFNEFVSSDGTDITSSLSRLINETVALLEKMTQSKLGKPLGKSNGGTIDPTLLESARSGTSLTHLKMNLLVIEDVYHGAIDHSDPNRIGLEHYLAFIKAGGNDPLTTRVENQFSACHSALDQIDNPLRNSLLSETQRVESAYDELKKLLVLFKADISSQLGITITFNDNDGD